MHCCCCRRLLRPAQFLFSRRCWPELFLSIGTTTTAKLHYCTTASCNSRPAGPESGGALCIVIIIPSLLTRVLWMWTVCGSTTTPSGCQLNCQPQSRHSFSPRFCLLRHQRRPPTPLLSVSTMKWWHLSSREHEFERPAVASVPPARLLTPNAVQMTLPPSAGSTSSSSSSSSSSPRRPKCCSCCLPLVAVLKRKAILRLNLIHASLV